MKTATSKLHIAPCVDDDSIEIANAATELSSDAVEGVLSVLETEGIEQLRARWRALRGGEPPDFRTHKLRRAVAYAVQANLHGDLTERELRELRLAGGRNTGVSRRMSPGAGTKILRSWGGQVHEVLVVDDGYLWKGTTWASLSRIAQEITGTKWNGPNFFGLRSKPADTAAKGAAGE